MEKNIDSGTVETNAVVKLDEIPAFLARKEQADKQPDEVAVQTESDVGGTEVTVH